MLISSLKKLLIDFIIGLSILVVVLLTAALLVLLVFRYPYYLLGIVGGVVCIIIGNEARSNKRK